MERERDKLETTDRRRRKWEKGRESRAIGMEKREKESMTDRPTGADVSGRGDGNGKRLPSKSCPSVRTRKWRTGASDESGGGRESDYISFSRNMRPVASLGFFGLIRMCGTPAFLAESSMPTGCQEVPDDVVLAHQVGDHDPSACLSHRRRAPEIMKGDI